MFSSTYQLTDSLIKMTKDSINYLDSLSQINSGANYIGQREMLLSSLNNLSSVIQSIIAQRKAAVDGQIASTQSLNASVMATEITEQNFKYINEISLIIEKDGIEQVASDYSNILAIAQQCPLSGGPAVFTARAIVYYFDKEIEYEDETNCLLQGYFRKAGKEKKVVIEDVILTPNPATNTVRLNFSTLVNQKINVTVLSPMGQSIVFNELSVINKVTQLNTSTLTSGIYHLKIVTDDQQEFIRKLTIIK